MKNEGMNRILSYVLVALLSVTLTVAVMLGIFAFSSRNTSKLSVLERLITECFIGQVDQTAMEDAAAEAMVQALGDRWSYYIPAKEYQAYQEQMKNAYVGVGITISVQDTAQGIQVLEVVAGGPAETAGMQVNDLIVKVDGQSVAGMTTSEIKTLIQGEAGTVVQIDLLRENEEITLDVTRQEIRQVVVKSRMLEDGIGLITIANFNSNCATETLAAIDVLREQGAQKLIFDVRNNPGGYADELVKILDYLLPEGKLFTRVDYTGAEHTDMSDADCLEMPMAVLVNGNSYSAAEFFAAALDEYDAAVVVGEKTSGKGYYQSVFQLPDGSAVGLSIGKYYTPNGVSLADAGLTPEELVEVDAETAALIRAGQLEASQDPQIQAAIQALS